MSGATSIKTRFVEVMFRDPNSPEKILKFFKKCQRSFKDLEDEINDDVKAADLVELMLQEYKGVYGYMNLILDNFDVPKKFRSQFFRNAIPEIIRNYFSNEKENKENLDTIRSLRTKCETLQQENEALKSAEPKSEKDEESLEKIKLLEAEKIALQG